LSTFVGDSIQVCRNRGRHIVAIEEDEDIFKELLAPMRSDLVPRAPAGGHHSDQEDEDDDDDEDDEVPPILIGEEDLAYHPPEIRPKSRQ
jgi:hypothetical protein